MGSVPVLQPRRTQPASAAIRVLTERDVPAVAALLRRVYPEHGWTSESACEAYFRRILFDNPWRDLELPSWVAEERGRICGLYAVLPRRMVLRGRPLRVAVGCQFMVDPAKRHSLTALQLVKACISGPQDLTLADGANDQARRMWIGLGGTAPLLYSLHWIRPLRPARHLLSVLNQRRVLSPALTLAARPVAALVDALAARLRPNRFLEEVGIADEALTSAAMLTHMRDMLNGSALQPAYDARSLAWLLEQAAGFLRHGKLRGRAVLDRQQRVLGWYLYYVQPGGVSEVLQLAARNGSFDCVLQRLLADAWQQGAAAVRGRLEPRFAQHLSDRHCWLRMEGPWTLVHSRRADVIDAIQQGNAFFSRLEGEWWLRFQGR